MTSPPLFVGADLDQLQALARRMDDAACRLTDLSANVTVGVESAVAWRGPDAARFRAFWASQGRAPLAAAARDLAAAADALRRQAAQQDYASVSGGPRPPESGMCYLDPDQDDAGTPARHPTRETDIALDSGSLTPDDIHQGDMDDCFLLASLGAVTSMNPDFLAHQVRAEPSGGYSVTLYEPGGAAHVVTVDGTFVDQGARGANGVPNYAAIYEKAVAAYREQGYQTTLNWGRAFEAMTLVTGQDVTIGTAASGTMPSPADVRRALDEGRPVVLDSPAQSSRALGPIVPEHSYIVVAAGEDGSVTVRNPWGPDGGSKDGVDKPGVVRLSGAEYARYFHQAAIGAPMAGWLPT